MSPVLVGNGANVATLPIETISTYAYVNPVVAMILSAVVFIVGGAVRRGRTPLQET